MRDFSHQRLTVDWMSLIGDREQDQREVKEGTKKERKKANRKNERGNRRVKGSGMMGGGDC